MFYSVLALGYLGFVSKMTYEAVVSYQKSKAPTALKKTRFAMHLANLGLAYSLGIYVISKLGAEALAHIILLDQFALLILNEIPKVFPIVFLCLKTINMLYKAYLFALHEKVNAIQMMQLITDILFYMIQLALLVSFLTHGSAALLLSMIFLELLKYPAQEFLKDLFELYEKYQTGKQIDWQALLANLYIKLSFSVYFLMLGLNAGQLKFLVLEGVFCAISAVYMLLKTSYEFYLNPKLDSSKLLQITLFNTQFILAAAALTGEIVLAPFDIFSRLWFAMISNINIFIASKLTKPKYQEEYQLQVFKKAEVRDKTDENTTVKEYLFFKQEAEVNAKQKVWKDAVPPNPVVACA